MIFIDLNTQNILVPWIYLFYNNDFTSHFLPPSPKPMVASSVQGSFAQKKSSKSSGGIGGSTIQSSATHLANPGLSANGNTMVQLGNLTNLQGGMMNIHNSNIGAGESEMDIEFGYCSEEESIFQSFC